MDGTLDYIPITYNAHDTANMKLDPATPYVKCNDWVVLKMNQYISKYKFHNKLYLNCVIRQIHMYWVKQYTTYITIIHKTKIIYQPF